MWWGLITMCDDSSLEIRPSFLETIAQKNGYCFDELMASLELGLGSFQIFIASCDPDLQRLDIVERYERELGDGVLRVRTTLDRDEPSLQRAIATALEGIKTGDGREGVVTVMGAEALDGLLDDEGR